MATTQRDQGSARKPRTENRAPATGAAEPAPAEKIAARAYQIWQESGCPEGKQEEHWFRAEQELRQQRR